MTSASVMKELSLGKHNELKKAALLSVVRDCNGLTLIVVTISFFLIYLV